MVLGRGTNRLRAPRSRSLHNRWSVLLASPRHAEAVPAILRRSSRVVDGPGTPRTANVPIAVDSSEPCCAGPRGLRRQSGTGSKEHGMAEKSPQKSSAKETAENPQGKAGCQEAEARACTDRSDRPLIARAHACSSHPNLTPIAHALQSAPSFDRRHLGRDSLSRSPGLTRSRL